MHKMAWSQNACNLSAVVKFVEKQVDMSDASACIAL